MTVIFVSGTIGSGKSQFCAALAKLGAESVSADQIVADLYSDDKWCHSLEDFVQQSFRDSSGKFDKTALAAAAFSDEKLRQALERFIHPQVRAKLQEAIAKSQSKVFVYEIPILRTDTDRSIADVVVRVDAPFDLRLARLISRGMTEDDALTRMNVQDADKQRNVDVDVVVTNDGTVQRLQDQADQLFEIWSKQ
jgi:dephospho-CoA kinase